ncbi:MAG: ABC transporter transmembrane domain-containing protein [Acidobacteriota bacterium]
MYFAPHLQRIKLLQPFVGRLLLGLFFMVLAVAIQLAYPKVLAYSIDHINTWKNSDWYGQLALIMLAVIIIQAIATTLRYYIFESTGYMIVTKVRQQMYGALIQQNISYYDRHHVGELTNRLAVDVEVLHNTLTMGLAIALRCFCVAVGGVVMLLVISPALTLILLFFIPASLLMGEWAGKKFQHLSKEIQRSQAECGKVANEHFTHIRLVHAFNQHKTALAKYARACSQALSISVTSTRFLAMFRGASSLLIYLALLFTLWLGARLINQGALTIGELTSFILYASMVTDSASAISDFWSDWMHTIGATEKVFEIISSQPRKTGTAPEKLHLHGNIAFEEVTFAYPERAEKLALDGISFKVCAGEKVALVGASGAGKSTIANLILGFYLPNQGRILFDNTYETHAEMAAIREHIAIVEQEPSLFSGTIFENIAFAVTDYEVSQAEVVEVAKLAYAHEFIESFPDGYHTIVGERGVQLSGGQKQRIAIARALLRNPKILILDEATSALDAASESQVQAALEQLMAGRTTLIIAHRYSTIVKADRILVLEHGSIVQQGSHAELITEQEGLYFSLMQHQLAEYRPSCQRSLEGEKIATYDQPILIVNRYND